jgi:hypothetical protein
VSDAWAAQTSMQRATGTVPSATPTTPASPFVAQADANANIGSNDARDQLRQAVTPSAAPGAAAGAGADWTNEG